MSSDDNHRQAHMTPTAHKICGFFTTSSFNFHPPTYFVSHFVAEGHYMLCSIEEFFLKKVEQHCLTIV